MIVSDGRSRHHGGMALFYKESSRFAVEAQQQHGLNFVNFQLVKGRGLWHVVGYYLAPRGTSTLESVVTEIVHRPRGAELLIAGDFNIDLEFMDVNERNYEIASVMVTEGLKYMMEHFLPCKIPCTQDGRIWSILCRGQEVKSWMDNILGTNRRLFQNVTIRDPRHITDHYMVLGCLLGVTLK